MNHYKNYNSKVLFAALNYWAKKNKVWARYRSIDKFDGYRSYYVREFFKDFTKTYWDNKLEVRVKEDRGGVSFFMGLCVDGEEKAQRLLDLFSEQINYPSALLLSLNEVLISTHFISKLISPPIHRPVERDDIIKGLTYLDVLRDASDIF